MKQMIKAFMCILTLEFLWKHKKLVLGIVALFIIIIGLNIPDRDTGMSPKQTIRTEAVHVSTKVKEITPKINTNKVSKDLTNANTNIEDAGSSIVNKIKNTIEVSNNSSNIWDNRNGVNVTMQ